MVEKAAKGRKTRSAGRFGPRYGRKARKQVADIEEQMRQEHTCPKCGRKSVVRKGTGIWYCRKCRVKFAGGTYLPYTSIAKTVMRSIGKGVETESEIESESEGKGKIKKEKETAKSAKEEPKP